MLRTLLWVKKGPSFVIELSGGGYTKIMYPRILSASYSLIGFAVIAIGTAWMLQSGVTLNRCLLVLLGVTAITINGIFKAWEVGTLTDEAKKLAARQRYFIRQSRVRVETKSSASFQVMWLSILAIGALVLAFGFSAVR